MDLKKALIRVHQYTGLVMSLFFVVWFVSGIFMMYTDFPSVTEREARQHRRPVDWEKVQVMPEQVLSRSGISRVRPFQITMMGQRPVYHVWDTSGHKVVFYADTGEQLDTITRKQSRAILNTLFPDYPEATALYKMWKQDQWTPQGHFREHLPFYVFYPDDKQGSQIYISGATGEVVQKHTRNDRLLAWLGPIPHWIYFTFLRVHHDGWVWVILVVSGIGVVVALSGLIIGVWQLRKRNNGRWIPYKAPWLYWHQVVGLVFGVFVFTWVLSGLFSMNPGDYSTSTSLTFEEQQCWRKTLEGDSTLEGWRTLPGLNLKVKVIKGHYVNSIPFYFFYTDKGLDGFCRAGKQHPRFRESFDRSFLLKAVKRVSGANSVGPGKLLKTYDTYYYSTDDSKPLPVWRFKERNTEKVYYVDPASGKMVHKATYSNRIHRWLYQGLHTWDFWGSWYGSISWQVVMMLLLAGGATLSITGVVIGVKWLRR